MAAKVAAQIGLDIDRYCQITFNDGHRNHLGASVIGKPCGRALWYMFRWVRNVVHPGRLYRLFNRGHLEERRFVNYLRGIGCTVYEYEPEYLQYHPESDCYLFSPNETEMGDVDALSNVTGIKEHEEEAARRGLVRINKQFRVSDVEGHFGGSLDAVVILPPQYGIKEPILGEWKTSGDGPHKLLVKKGMKIAKPEHFTQTSIYGKLKDFTHVLYMSVNKNNDELHIEIVKLSENEGNNMIEKAKRIIYAQAPLPRYSEDPNNRDCIVCDYTDVCHRGFPADKNCRSCYNCTPTHNAAWRCNLYDAVIPPEVIKEGCPEWRSIIHVETDDRFK